MRIVQPVIEQLKAQSHPVCHYIYDLDELKSHLQHITSSLPSNCQMYYAMKANSERTIQIQLVSMLKDSKLHLKVK